MKKFTPFLFFFLFFACKKHTSSNTPLGTWEMVGVNSNGPLPADPVGFSIGSRLYVGTGARSVGATKCFAYDMSTGAWLPVAAYPEPTMLGSNLGFAIGGTGFVLLAQFFAPGKLSAYDTAQNVWTNRADYPGILTDDTRGFGLNGKAYVGFGDTSDARGFYQYDPASDAWTRVSDFPGAQISGTASFVVGGYAYIGLGGNLLSLVDQALYKQFYRYDAASDSWRGCADFPGALRSGATGFSVGNMGYIAGGIDANGNYLKDVWQYDPAANTWARQADFPGVGRVAALGFSGVAAGYFGFGAEADAPAYSDLWKFTPAP